MKYMHLNSSCPYAGLANMLMLHGHDTEDVQIALDIDLPSHIHYDEESGSFQSGFSLQSKEWFDLYLNPRGFTYTEQFWSRTEVTDRLQPGMMLGIFIAPGQKHAVICSGIDKSKATFINNKRKHTEEPEILCFTHEELTARLSETVAVGCIISAQPTAVNRQPIYEESLQTWELLRRELHDFMSSLQTAERMRQQLNPLFRPLLLDGLTMAQLRQDTQLSVDLTALQRALLDVLRRNVSVRPADHIDIALLNQSIDKISQHARNHLDNSKKYP